MPQCEVSVIIVSWNVAPFLRKCLQSLQEALRDISHEIIVVDNASQDNTVSMIEEEFPQVHVLAESVNWGFGKANNKGLRRSSGKYIFILNPDTEVQGDAIKTLLECCEKNSRIGFVGPKVVNTDGSFQAACRRTIPTPQSAFYKMMGLTALFPKHPRWARYQLGHLDENSEMDVEAISGSCMLLRREAMGSGFDERYFMYGEDLDLCLTVRHKGFIGWYCPRAVVVHHHRKSSSQSRLRTIVRFYYAAYLFFHKYYLGKTNILLFVLIVTGLVVRAFLACVKELLRLALTMVKRVV